MPIVKVTREVAIGTDDTIAVEVYSDEAQRRGLDITGKAVTVLVLNPGIVTAASAVSYTVTATSASIGRGTITLTGASHTIIGDANAQVHVDGMLRGRFTIPFVALYS